ncbi:MAG: N-acetylmuramoyl-L-alanine amidase [Spirulina sp. SIO3F2]|nr:N-acetylmuramoyl-L-alanine amidase [Spirulina sp. SIO3F2]
MKRLGLGWAIIGTLGCMTHPVYAQANGLFIAYPPDGHQTTSEQIFIIGSGPGAAAVLINGEMVDQSPDGHFAPSFPLRVGANQFVIQQGGQSRTVTVTRQAPPQLPTGDRLVPSSLVPQQNLTRLVDEQICLSAIAPADRQVSARVAGRIVNLAPQPSNTELPPNSAILTDQNEPITSPILPYKGCFTSNEPIDIGVIDYELTRTNTSDIRDRQTSSGQLRVISPHSLDVVEVTAREGVARTGPSTNYSRLTPLPQGTRVVVSGQEGEWLRLSYGAWIKASETQPIPGAVPPQATIRSLSGRQIEGATEIRFPLTEPVPIAVEQGDRTFKLTLYHVVAQTDTIWLDDDPLIRRLDWQQTTPTQLDYTFALKTDQQWGYTVRYEGSTLVLVLRHPPQLPAEGLRGINILLDPGHGGAELGARGPNGYPEKAVNLDISNYLRQELEQRGATVYMTRTSDVDLGLRDRMDDIARIQPHLAFSVHYNALPDSGDAINTAGIGMFWYHPQAHDLAMSLHNHLVDRLDRPSYGVFWNNLALTRPHAAPTILMELGFMINPLEFEWVTDRREQVKLAGAIADGIEGWLREKSP